MIARGSYTFGYDGTTGNLSSITAPDGDSLAYTYDGPILLAVAVDGAGGGTVTWDYDADLAVSMETVCDALTACHEVTFAYDTDKLLTRAGEMQFARDGANGQLTKSDLGGALDTWSYNTLGETATYESRFDDIVRFGEEYTRDGGGRITSKRVQMDGNIAVLDYGYDVAGRLTDVTRDGTLAAHYEYDTNGNRLSKSTAAGTETSSCDGQDRLTSYGEVTYTYTPSGELDSSTDGAGTTDYVYDELGNLIEVRLPDGRVIEYDIDGQNRRVGRMVNGTVTHRWLYADGLRVVAELDAAGAIITRFVYGTRGNVPEYMVKDGTNYRIIADHLGSPRLIVNTDDGTVAQRIDYDEFGKVLADSNPGFQPFGFAGGLYDRDTGLVRFGARDYDAYAGRWTAKEPLGFAGGDTNFYAYAFNDPVNFIDPNGLDAVTADSHFQEIAQALWKKANWGMTPYEVFAFITQDPNTCAYGCKQVPGTYEQNQFTIKKGTTAPPNAIALIHTHPNNRTSEPDDRGDMVATGSFKKQLGISVLYTISKKGVGKYVAGANDGSQEETSLKFPNAAKDGCGCAK